MMHNLMLNSKKSEQSELSLRQTVGIQVNRKNHNEKNKIKWNKIMT